MYTRTLRPSPIKHIYKFASHKNGNVQTVESSLEFNACFHFEYANEVRSFIAQPEGFYYQFEDRTCSYTPDFELFCHSGKKVFVEIKPPPEALKHDFIQRFTAKKKAVEMLGKELILVTDRQISSMPKLKNLKLINRYAGLYTEVVSRKKIYEWIRKFQGLTIADISELSGADSSEILVDVMWLVASGKVFINIEEIFGYESFFGLERAMSIDFFNDEFPDFQNWKASAFVDAQYMTASEHLSYISFDSLSNKLQEEAYYKYKVIMLVGERLQGGWTKKNIEPIINSLFEKGYIEKKPSYRSVARWHKSYDQDIGLKSLVSAKGLMKSPGNSKKDDADFYKRAVEEKFLKRERPHVSTAYYHYFNNILLYNRAHPDNIIEPITKSAFYKRVKKMSPYEVEVGRFGKAEADKNYRIVNKFSSPERVMERVEIDHTPLDLILLDDTLLIPIGRPYLTILIDCLSRCIIGFYLSFQEPSYNSVRSGIMNACLNKEGVIEKYQMIKKDWPCQGKIETLVVDNGAEFWSSNLEYFCASVGINIEFNPVGKPWKKPLVERLFAIYNSKFVKEIPGTTFSNAQELSGYKPEKDAVLPFSYFIELMHVWVVDIYNQSPNSRMTRIPALSWEMGCKKYPPPLYSGFEEKIFKIEAFPTESRILRKGGISIDGIDYTNEELVEYRKVTPPPPGSKVVKVVIKRDPEDVSYIYVYLVERKEYIKVTAVDPDCLYDGLSIFQLKVRRKLRRNFINSKTDYLGVAEAEKLIDDRVSEIAEEVSASKKKIKGTKKAAAYFGISSENPSSIMDGFASKEIVNIEEESKSHSGVNPNDEEWKRISDDLEPYS